MSGVDIDHLQKWVGKSRSDSDVLTVRRARLMAATLGQDAATLEAGAPLPPLWHWIYFLEGLPPTELGRDGHPARGGFLPPVPLANRMWAGGTVDILQPLPLGTEVEKRSRILSVEHKHGRSGELVFVSVLHEILLHGEVAVSEIHDLVYKDPTPPGAGSPPPQAPMAAERSEHFRADSTTLFRYSALTFNGHRIHYDLDYCRNVEHYPNLVIHGPLQATLLAELAERATERPLKTFRYRGLQPAILGADMSVNAANDSDGLELWTGLPDGTVAMRAQAGFERQPTAAAAAQDA